MILLDSNIIIYSGMVQYSYLRNLLEQSNILVSIISKLEVLGYHKITPEQILYFDAIFRVVENAPVSAEIVTQAIEYRRKKAMSVADSIIAATAILYKCDLYTNNVSDFKNIKDFKIVNPIKSTDSKISF
jgi:predicted nucleic acid-binding protein